MINNDFIKAILKEKESNQLAYFFEINLTKIGETVCAFLNANGGRILVGVNKNGDINTFNNLDEEYDNLRKFIYNSIIPESLIGIRKEDLDEQQIILIEVIEGNKKPYSINNRTYIRSGKETKVANDDDMSNLIRSRRKDDYSWEKSPVLEATLEDLDFDEIKKAINQANTIGRSSKFNIDEPIKFLTNFQLFRNNQLTNAAIVLFGKDPSYFLPQCRIRIVDFGSGKNSNRYNDTFLVEQNLFKSFTDIQNYFTKNLPIISDFSDSDWKRQDRLKYPLRALDEAIINAMMHRDYSDATGEVFIGIYKNKIEIINSGELPESLSDKDLKKSHRSIPPNPGITHIVYLCGMIEKVGRGTQLINELFEELNLESPKWISKNGATTLILHGEAKMIQLNNRMTQFLAKIELNKSYSRDDYMSFINENINERTARMDLQKLTEGGWLKKMGDGPQTKYLKTNAKMPDFSG